MLDEFVVCFGVYVRRCEERDLGPLEWFGAFTPHRAFIREQFERDRRGSNVMLVADRAGYPVGQVWIDLEKRAAERAAFVWALRVIEPLQGLGIGARLLSAAERVAGAAGAGCVEVGVEKKNVRARPFYERRGFVLVGEETAEQEYLGDDGSVSRQVYVQWIFRKAYTAAAP